MYVCVYHYFISFSFKNKYFCLCIYTFTVVLPVRSFSGDKYYPDVATAINESMHSQKWPLDALVILYL